MSTDFGPSYLSTECKASACKADNNSHGCSTFLLIAVLFAIVLSHLMTADLIRTTAQKPCTCICPTDK